MDNVDELLPPQIWFIKDRLPSNLQMTYNCEIQVLMINISVKLIFNPNHKKFLNLQKVTSVGMVLKLVADICARQRLSGCPSVAIHLLLEPTFGDDT